MTPHPSHPRTPSDFKPGFWQTRAFVAFAVLVTMVPLVWPDVAPLTDLPGHMGRYKVQVDLDQSVHLQRYYDFDWALIGNLGVDLLVMPLSKLFGLELAVKLIVMAIPALTVFGFLWVAREVHGQVPPTALFALPFAYGHPFQFGFVNSSLSMAFAFLAFALWLRMARYGQLRLRAVIFVPISMLIWVTHTYGWGTLGLMAFSAEAVRQHDRGRPWYEAIVRSGVHCLSLAPPVLLMLAWRSGHVGGVTADWFNLQAKFRWVIMTLRDRWRDFDIVSLILVILLLLEAIRHRKLEYSRNLAASVLVLLLVYLVLPRIVFGSAYADMRLVPYLFAVAVIAIRYKTAVDPRVMRSVALAGLAFFLIRTGGTTVSFWLFDRAYDRELAALDHVPRGARMISMVGERCGSDWMMTRLHHLPGLAIVRKEAYSNEQWVMEGAQLLRVHYAPAEEFFQRDPSQIVTFRKCPREPYRTIRRNLSVVPRDAFDYIWLITPPPYDARLTQGLRPIWRSGRSVLYRVER